MKRSAHIACLLGLGSVLLLGCDRWATEERAVLERDTATLIHKALWLHEDRFPNRPRTNLTVVFRELEMEYPVHLHERFRGYGRDAGFTNSLFERYVFVGAQMTNKDLQGELVYLSARPYVSESGQPVRIAFLRRGSGSEGWTANEFSEQTIRESLKSAEIEMPKPVPLASGPSMLEGAYRPPLGHRIRRFFENVAYYYGPGRFFWLPTMLICVGVPILGAIIVIVWFTRHRR